MKTFLYRTAALGSLLLFLTQVSRGAQSFDHSHLDPDKIVPSKLLAEALSFYDQNAGKIKNREVMGIIDFSKHSSKERFYVIDMSSGLVKTYLTAHGKNSDPDGDGFATLFSNRVDSLMSSLGFFLTAETYFGDNGYSLRLDGLSPTNSRARERLIVIHGADYVAPGRKVGRSFGCPALEMRYHEELIDLLKEGALIYAGLSLLPLKTLSEN